MTDRGDRSSKRAAASAACWPNRGTSPGPSDASRCRACPTCTRSRSRLAGMARNSRSEARSTPCIGAASSRFGSRSTGRSAQRRTSAAARSTARPALMDSERACAQNSSARLSRVGVTAMAA